MSISKKFKNENNKNNLFNKMLKSNNNILYDYNLLNKKSIYSFENIISSGMDRLQVFDITQIYLHISL